MGFRFLDYGYRLSRDDPTGQGDLNMNDIVVLLLLFASCTGCVILKVEDKRRCDPVCTPYAYEYTDADGTCVCNLQKLHKEAK